jgi:hypothetical protein
MGIIFLAVRKNPETSHKKGERKPRRNKQDREKESARSLFARNAVVIRKWKRKRGKLKEMLCVRRSCFEMLFEGGKKSKREFGLGGW